MDCAPFWRFGVAVGLLVQGCSSAGGSKPGIYEHCVDQCAVGTCQYQGWLQPDGFSCTVACTEDAQCPALEDGSPAICLNQACRPVACNGTGVGSTYPPIVCIDGMLQRCEMLASPPCSLCPVCGATEYCDGATETCYPKKLDGQPCTTSSECPTGDCRTFTWTDGTVLFDGKRFCRFPTGAPCWSGDPCFCDRGSCSFSCSINADCPDKAACVYTSLSSGSCRNQCTAGAAVCGPNAICDDIGTITSPAYVCAATGSRPPRAAGVPCRTDAECLSGACCPPGVGETWGHCAGDAGC